MAVEKKRRVLYFINGSNPSPDEVREASQLGNGVLFRNARYIKDDATLEPFDAVAGPAIPERYTLEVEQRRSRRLNTVDAMAGMQAPVGIAAGQSPATARTAPHSPQKGVELPRPANGEGDARDPANVPANPNPDKVTTDVGDGGIDPNKNRNEPITPNGKPEGMPKPAGDPPPVVKQVQQPAEVGETVDPKSTKSADDQKAKDAADREKNNPSAGTPAPVLPANANAADVEARNKAAADKAAGKSTEQPAGGWGAPAAK